MRSKSRLFEVRDEFIKQWKLWRFYAELSCHYEKAKVFLLFLVNNTKTYYLDKTFLFPMSRIVIIVIFVLLVDSYHENHVVFTYHHTTMKSWENFFFHPTFSILKENSQHFCGLIVIVWKTRRKVYIFWFVGTSRWSQTNYPFICTLFPRWLNERNFNYLNRYLSTCISY